VRRRMMTACLMLCLVTSSVLAADMISGKWTGDWGPNDIERNHVVADLKYDGKTVTGTIDPGTTPVTISKGTFNEKTGDIHLQAEGKGRGTVTNHYSIDGKLEKNKIKGTWKYENGSGDFVISKQ